MGVNKHTYIGPYVMAKERVRKLEYKNLACPNNKCRANKNPTRLQTVSIKFCQECGHKMENQTFEEPYRFSLYEILAQQNVKKQDRLSEIRPHECDKLKKNQIIFITNIKFKHSTHFDEGDSIIYDFFGDKKHSDAMLDFRSFFEKELVAIHENYDDIEYNYGVLAWFW